MRHVVLGLMLDSTGQSVSLAAVETSPPWIRLVRAERVTVGPRFLEILRWLEGEGDHPERLGFHRPETTVSVLVDGVQPERAMKLATAVWSWPRRQAWGVRVSWMDTTARDVWAPTIRDGRLTIGAIYVRNELVDALRSRLKSTREVLTKELQAEMQKVTRAKEDEAATDEVTLALATALAVWGASQVWRPVEERRR